MKRINVIASIFSAAAIAMFIYTSFIATTTDAKYKNQGIIWFSIALVSLLLPEVSKIKLKDIEVEFREKLESVERKVIELEDKFFESLEERRKKEEGLSSQFIEMRNRDWDNFQGYINSLDEETRFKVQKLNSVRYLERSGLSVRELKEMLKKLGYYEGAMDDEFSKDLAKALIQFQRLKNMRHVDGFFGELTHEKMVEELQIKATRTEI